MAQFQVLGIEQRTNTCPRQVYINGITLCTSSFYNLFFWLNPEFLRYISDTDASISFILTDV